ncbi:MAG: hypothetical protein GVY07_10815 [Bacteroidetes bacterium]|jgi:magnesium-transporting ATPase (P-type)|nr:hypothetical protein [Bacteroidota bacterium]
MSITNEKESGDENSKSKQSRWFFVGMAVFLMLFVILGFGSTYGRQLVLGLEISGHNFVETDWVVHIHAIVFMGWMTLLLTQTVLVSRAKTQKHMTLGKLLGGVLALAVVIAGNLIIYKKIQSAVSEGLITWAEWRTILYVEAPSWYLLLGFGFLVGLALHYRKQPAEHKRYMIFATIMLAIPATSRMEYLLGSWNNIIGICAMIAPPIVYDFYTEHRMQKATLVGMGFIGVFLAYLILLKILN